MNLPEPKVGWIECDGNTERTVVRELNSRDIRVEDYSVDLGKYARYFEQARYSTLYAGYYPSNIHEKSLEHFIALDLLCLCRGDLYIDIASEGSPVPEIYKRLFGCDTYRQDLSYPAGFQDNTIGSNAAALPVPDGFASKLGLHCSFEHFEGDSDIGFVKEASRILKPGGMCVVLPLYMFTQYAVQTDPALSRGVQFEPDASIYYAQKYGNRQGRFYDALHLKSRVIANLGGMDFTLYRVTNAKQVDQSCYLTFALLLEKPGTPSRSPRCKNHQRELLPA